MQKELEKLAQRRARSLMKKWPEFPELYRPMRLSAKTYEVTVKLVGSAKMKKLNHQYRGKNYATDVLSFPTPTEFRSLGLLGELVICLPVLRRQAREAKINLKDELQIVLVHGLLHLLGWDHEISPTAAKKMETWEDRLLPRRLKGLIKRSALC